MRKTGVLLIIALLCAVYLSTALTVLGLDKFSYILAGGRKFATFPSLSSQLGIGSSYLILAVIYLIWFLQPRRVVVSRFLDCLRIAAVFLVLAFLAYPLGNDVYLYLHSGLMNLSAANPFVTRAGSFISELSPFVDWGQTSTYGPVSQALFTLSAIVLKVHPVLAVYTYKGICLGFHILNGYAIWKLLPPDQRGKITIAYLLNPLLLMEQVGSGHIDVLVSSSLILLGGSLLQQRYSLSFVALWLGVLAKTLPLVWMPLVGVFFIRQRRWKALAVAVLLSAGLVSVLSLTVMPGIAAWRSLLNPGVTGQYQSSLHAIAKFGLDLVRIFSPATMNLAQEKALLLKLSHYTLIGFAGFYGWMVWKIYRQRNRSVNRSVNSSDNHSSDNPSGAQLIEDIGWVTLVLLLFATPWLMPWYASALLTIAALIPGAQLFGITTLMFGLSSSAQYLLQGHDSLKSVISVGLPIATLIIASRAAFLRPIRASNASTAIVRSESTGA